MLQQTQVAVVIPYFEKWMATFPTIEALAKAPVESVLKCWEGLGYYSRARNLHQAASQILDHYAGELPSSQEALENIKGIGAYTQGAIRSFAFKQKAAAVDGNVLRVLSRFLALEEPIDQPKVKKKLEAYAASILPESEPWLISEGLIELGATVCSKKAHCTACPLRKECLAYRHGKVQLLPIKAKRTETIFLKRAVAVVVCDGRYLLQKGSQGKVMADLYEFPYLEMDATGNEELMRQFEQALGLRLTYIKPLKTEEHSFTRYKVQLFPHLMEAQQGQSPLWIEKEKLGELPFSSGHRRILTGLLSK